MPVARKVLKTRDTSWELDVAGSIPAHFPNKADGEGFSYFLLRRPKGTCWTPLVPRPNFADGVDCGYFFG
ncbi:hypothetical protein EHM76_00550 [bacterium]|nr:MAG: hypothetical protein EHM76_00550 [bacterium]